MPPKKERLTKRDFSSLGKKKAIKTPLFDVVYSPSETIKVGCVVLKKRTKKAVDRNKIKRKIYNAYSFYKKDKTTVIFYPHNETLRTPQEKIKSEIKKIFDTLE